MNDKLPEQSCASFTVKLASREAVPGGGGAAALIGSLGAALGEMAGNLTVGKKKYAAYEEDLQRMIRDADILRQRFLALIDADAAAFEPLSRAYSMPKDDPHYTETMTAVTLAACKAPYEMMECCCETVELLEEMREKCSALMISDVGCGALAVRASLEAAYLNVLINTRSLAGNRDARLMEWKAEALLNEYLPRAQAVAEAVTEHLRRKDNG